MMKKLISVLCVLAMVIGVAAVSAVSANGAVDAAKTMVEVKNGQDVTYRLKLGGVECALLAVDVQRLLHDLLVVTAHGSLLSS